MIGKKCPKCFHERTEDDGYAPDYECPKCGIVYAKVKVQKSGPSSDDEKIKLIKATALEIKKTDTKKKLTTKCPVCREEIKSGAIKCKHCKSSIGAPLKGYEGTTRFSIRYVLLAIVIIPFFMIIGNSDGYSNFYSDNSGNPSKSDSLMQSIEKQVARDSVEEYYIALRQGDKIQICVQAGMVSAAFLQAHDEINYQKWKRTEKSDCSLAGL